MTVEQERERGQRDAEGQAGNGNGKWQLLYERGRTAGGGAQHT